MLKKLVAISLLTLLTACASVLEPGRGLDAARLQRLESAVRADVAAKRIPGVVMLVARDGKVVLNSSVGQQDPQKGIPMQPDSIFRLYSMTKPVVSVAAMMLVEEGRLQLSDPVAQHIPELKGLRVGVEKEGKLEIVPSLREPTVHDLLRHTSGFTYGVFGKSLVKDLYTKNDVDGVDHDNAQLVKKLATVPLMYQPGTTWEYGRSTDVLGHVVERVAKMPLDRFLEERIFRPLGMKDTAFYVPAEKLARLAEPFAGGSAMLDVTKMPKYLAGGQGLVGTAADYLRFAQMLLNGGELEGKRLLAKKTVDFMTTDHLGAIRGPTPGYGFGLGFTVRLADGQSPLAGTAGDYNWAGLGGTYFWVDPKERLVAVWMMQNIPLRNYYRGYFRNLVYGAMND